MKTFFEPKLKFERRAINEKTLVYTINDNDVIMNLFNNKIKSLLLLRAHFTFLVGLHSQ